MDKTTLFGTSGIRGDAEKLFTKKFCIDIGIVFVEFLKKKNLLSSIAIGMDPRLSGPRIKNDLICGLAFIGKTIYDQGITPIPSMNWLIKNTDTKAAVMITGSHIASNLNGLKFYSGDQEITVDDQNLINELYSKNSNTKTDIFPKPTVVVEKRAQKLYLDLLKSLITQPQRKCRVAVDCANGAQSVVIPEFLESLKFDVVKINCKTDRDFIARDTDTDDKAQLDELKKAVIDEKCDLGIAFDGDGDRVVFLDEKSNFIQGEYGCSLIAKESNSSVIVTTISASQVVDRIGKNIVRTKVGSPYVIDEMKKNNSGFGFEPNGGAISAEIMYTRDGGTMMVKMLNLFNEHKGTFSSLINELPKYFMFRTKVDYQWEQKNEIIKKAINTFKGIKTEDMDGIKIWIDKTTWILFRSSQNAPEFRVFAESDDENKAKSLIDSGLNLVKSVI